MPGSGGFSPTTVCRPGKGFDWNTGENSAGLSDYAPPDMRTIGEIDCAMCELNCAMVSLFLPGPMIPVSKKELAEFAGWGAEAIVPDGKDYILVKVIIGLLYAGYIFLVRIYLSKNDLN